MRVEIPMRTQCNLHVPSLGQFKNGVVAVQMIKA